MSKRKPSSKPVPWSRQFDGADYVERRGIREFRVPMGRQPGYADYLAKQAALTARARLLLRMAGEPGLEQVNSLPARKRSDRDAVAAAFAVRYSELFDKYGGALSANHNRLAIPLRFACDGYEGRERERC